MDFLFGDVDNLDAVPEQFRPLYAKGDDNKFKLQEQFKGVGDAVLGLNKALKSERENSKKRPTVDLTPLAEYGDSVDTILAGFKAKLKGLEDQGGKVNVEKLKQEFDVAHKGEVTKHQNRAQALQTQLYGLLVDNAATLAIVDAKGVPELLLPHIQRQVKVTEDNGKFQVLVVDDQGDQRFNSVTGQAMTIKDLVAEMKSHKLYGRAFESEAPSGSGKEPGSGKTPPAPKGAPMTSVDKIAAGLAKGVKRHGAGSPT